jgi:transcriptional regulator with XRE-family HTH domain
MLKEIRLKAGLSQSQLAEKSGVNVRMIQHYEQCTKDINGAHINTLASLANALSCPLSELLTDDTLRDKLKNTTL